MEEKQKTTGCAKIALILIIALALKVVFSSEEEPVSVPDVQTPETTSIQEKWYENGGLGKSDVATWKSAPMKRKIATAADWALASSKIKNQIEKSSSIDELKPYAIELVKCVDTAAAGSVDGSAKTADLVASCMILMGW